MRFKIAFILTLFLTSFLIGGCMSMIFEQPPADELINLKMWYFDRDDDGVIDEYIGLYKDKWMCYQGETLPDNIDEKKLYSCDDVIIQAVVIYLLKNPDERTVEINDWLKE